METILKILLSVIGVSLISFVGAAWIVFGVKKVEKWLFYLVSFAAGALIAAAFLDLLPEAKGNFAYALGGFLLFFALERLLRWHHHHAKKEIHAVSYLNLIGDGLHNLIDGAAIAASYTISTEVGIATTLAVIAHEIPQELGDFAVLLFGKMKPVRALAWNFVSALTAVLGALIAFYLLDLSTVAPLLAAVAAGGFIYIAGSDLLPELHKETKLRKALYQMLFFILGVAVIWATGILFVE